ncbi:tail fiber assembly protein [Escherichia coli]
MTLYLYSSSENAFYPRSLYSSYNAAGSWPQDAKDISDEAAFEFMGMPPTGKIRIVGDDGQPAWGDIPPLSGEEAVMVAQSQKDALMAEANAAIVPLQYAVTLGMATDDEKTRLTAWQRYCVLLNRVDASTAPEITLPVKPE